MMKKLDSMSDYLNFTSTLYKSGYFQESINVYDRIFKEIELDISPKATTLAFNTTAALESVNEVLDILSSNNIDAFPVAGTLLGLVRDGKLFDHDKDTDLGIFVDSYQEIYNIVSILCKEDTFISYDMLTNTKESHTWNVAIIDTERFIAVDLFFFYKKETHYEMGIWSTCGTLKWIFTPFHLIKKQLGDREYMIPDNYEYHLEELYGKGWKKPVIVWESLLNCPNLSKDSQKIVIYYALGKLYKAIELKNLKKFDNNYNTIRDTWGFQFSHEADENLAKIRKELVKLEEEKSE